MEERFITFLFRKISEKISDIRDASSNEEIDFISHEISDYVDELHEVVKTIMGA